MPWQSHSESLLAELSCARPRLFGKLRAACSPDCGNYPGRTPPPLRQGNYRERGGPREGLGLCHHVPTRAEESCLICDLLPVVDYPRFLETSGAARSRVFRARVRSPMLSGLYGVHRLRQPLRAGPVRESCSLPSAANVAAGNTIARRSSTPIEPPGPVTYIATASWFSQCYFVQCGNKRETKC